MKSLIMSSADATKYSTTFKGFALGLVPLIMMVTGMTVDDTEGLINAIEKLIFFGTALIASAQVVYGLVRKLYLGRWSAK